MEINRNKLFFILLKDVALKINLNQACFPGEQPLKLGSCFIMTFSAFFSCDCNEVIKLDK